MFSKSLLLTGALVVLLATVALAQFQARTDYGQRLEPIGDHILTDVGQTVNGYPPFYSTWVSAVGNQPAAFMTYQSMGATAPNLLSWASFIKGKMTAQGANNAVIQLGYDMCGNWCNGSDYILPQIIAGTYDANINGMCAAIQANFGATPIYVRIGDEFNGPWSGYYVSPASYAQAFQHVAGILHSCPGTHIATAWDLSLDADASTYMAYYPGDAAVDWWAINLYGTNHFSDPTGLAFVAAARAHSKPVLIGEAAPRGFVDTSDLNPVWVQWFTPYINYVHSQPNVKMLTYINIDWGQTTGWPTWGNSIVVKPSAVAAGLTAELANPRYLLASSNIGSQLYLASTTVPPSPSPAPTSSPVAPTPAPTSTAGGPVTCNPVITSPANGATVANPITVTVAPNCTGGQFGFIRFYANAVAPIDFPAGATSASVTLPSGSQSASVIIWDAATGTIKEGTSPGVSFTVGTVSSPTPTQTAAPTATASPSPAPTSTATAISTQKPTPTATPTPTIVASVIRANDFLNSMGAVTHDIQQKEPKASIINGFQYTGLRLGRDDATHNVSGVGSVQDLCDIHAATGVLYDELPIVDSDPNNIADTKAEWDQLAACGAMLQAEGPNEPNNQAFTYQGTQCNIGTTFAPCAAYMKDLYAMVKADTALKNFLVMGMTEVGAEPDNVGLQFLNFNGTQFADVANTHNYFQGNGPARTTPIDNHVRYAETIARIGPYAGLFDAFGEYWGTTWNKGFPGASEGQFDRPKVNTENGWNIFVSGANIGTDLVGRMTTDLYLDAIQLGWSQTFNYKMLDESGESGNSEFCNDSGTVSECTAGATPGTTADATFVGRYIHNLTTILADNSSAFTPVASAVSVSGLPATGYSQLFQKSNGTYEFVVWGEAFASKTVTPVTVTLPAVQAVKVYDVTAGTTPVQTLTASSVPLSLSDHAMIVEFNAPVGPTPTPTVVATSTPAATPTPGSCTLTVPVPCSAIVEH